MHAYGADFVASYLSNRAKFRRKWAHSENQISSALTLGKNQEPNAKVKITVASKESDIDYVNSSISDS